MLHADLFEVRADEKIKVRIPIILTGKVKGVTDGGILEQPRREVEVRCLPNAVPESLKIDASKLEIGESLHIQDVTLPEGVTVEGQTNFTIAAVVSLQEEAAATPAEGAEAAGADEAVDAAGKPAKPAGDAVKTGEKTEG